MKRAALSSLRTSLIGGAALAVAGIGLVFAASTAARAQVLDPLHGYCSVGCVDNGSNSPTTQNPILGFGFTISPGPATGSDFLIDVLAPNNEAHAPVVLTGTYAGTATLVNPTAWTSGDLDAYLGISATPNNPIGAYIPDPSDPGATGFFVYQISVSPVGGVTLQAASNPNVNPLENISGGVPLGSYIVGFLNEGTASSPDWLATANSGAILEQDAPPSGVPGPTAGAGLPGLALAGIGLFIGWRHRRRADA